MRSDRPHSLPWVRKARLKMELCRAFGWTPSEHDDVPARTREEFIILLDEENKIKEHDREAAKMRSSMQR